MPLHRVSPRRIGAHSKPHPSPVKAGLAVALLCVASLTGVACDETIEVGNVPTDVTAIGPVYQPGAPTRGGHVAIDYALRDTEFDDADIVVSVCTCSDAEDPSGCSLDACGLAIQGDGGDGTSRLPTVPPRSDLDSVQHTFVWDASVGRVSDEGVVSSQSDQLYVVGIAVAEGDDDPIYTAPFTLDAIGVTIEVD